MTTLKPQVAEQWLKEIRSASVTPETAGLLCRLEAALETVVAVNGEVVEWQRIASQATVLIQQQSDLLDEIDPLEES